jgi:HNH endonuclease
MRGQSDDYPDHLERVIHALLTEGAAAGAHALQPIAYPPRKVARRQTVSRPLRCAVFRRDGFRCRYCGGKTILEPLMALLSVIYPEKFPWHPNWRGGLTHPAVISRSAVVDHVEPVATGGSRGIENLVTACNPCNAIKADFTLEHLGWELQPAQSEGWDGLARFYRGLWEAAGRPNAVYHEGWMRDLGLAAIP